MKQWLISKIPTWVLRYLVRRNWRLRQASRLLDEWYWADLELFHREVFLCSVCYNDIDLNERCPFCYPPVLGSKKPVGIPKWLEKEYKPYGKGRDYCCGFHGGCDD